VVEDGGKADNSRTLGLRVRYAVPRMRLACAASLLPSDNLASCISYPRPRFAF